MGVPEGRVAVLPILAIHNSIVPTANNLVVNIYQLKGAPPGFRIFLENLSLTSRFNN